MQGIVAYGRAKDHPRLRGEYHIAHHIYSRRSGSSPLARGVHFDIPPSRLSARIIPACAGSTKPRTTPCPSNKDHPRLRGEYSKKSSKLINKEGSSPLARGVLYCIQYSALRFRIIPACAGSTLVYEIDLSYLKDHPRLRGEYSIVNRISYSMPGSSPLARGVPDISFERQSYNRIIPACAGSTLHKIP